MSLIENGRYGKKDGIPWIPPSFSGFSQQFYNVPELALGLLNNLPRPIRPALVLRSMEKGERGN